VGLRYIYGRTGAGYGAEILGDTKKSRLQEPYSPINVLSAVNPIPNTLKNITAASPYASYLSFIAPRTGSNGASPSRQDRGESVWYIRCRCTRFQPLYHPNRHAGGKRKTPLRFESLPDSTASGLLYTQ